MLHRFSQEYPGIHISLSVKTAPVVRDMLERHEIDLGIISTVPFASPELKVETICEDDLVLILSPKHPLASVTEPTSERIVSSSFVLHGTESSTRWLTEKWLQSNQLRLPSYLEFDSLEAIKQAVMLGEHVSFVSRMAVQAEVERGLLEIRPIPGNLGKRHVYAVTNKDRHWSALLNKFTEQLSLYPIELQQQSLFMNKGTSLF
ncbi:HTH-type transcriptional activator CmpR [compost metagenome]